MLALSIRLGVLITEIEQLPVPVLMEYVAMLNEEDKPRGDTAPATEADVEDQLRSVFGKPNNGKPE